MFLTLFLKECRQMTKCLTYYIIIICMILFYSTQLGNSEVVTEPQPGQESYGWTVSNDKAVIMEKTVEVFAREYHFNKYATYPFGFYKKVTLGNRKQANMGEILSKVTGWEKEKLDEFLKNDYFKANASGASGQTSVTVPSDAGVDQTELVIQEVTENGQASEINALPVKADLTYEQFTELMSEADKLLGGGSSYAKDSLQSNAYVHKTYEQALKDYQDIINKDHLTGAYARLFSDYMGIVLAILPVFITVTRVLRDRRAKANEIIFSRKASSLHIILPRYLAMLAMLLLPVIIIAAFLMLQCTVSASGSGIAIDYLAFPEYILGWLLPTLMVTVSAGMLITVLTDTAIAIIFQGLWWFISLMGCRNLIGGYGWNLVPRHNSLGYYQNFRDNFNILAANRIAYAATAIVLILAAAAVYDLKRKGRIDIRGKIFSNRKNKLRA